jgi:GT2 family glycosyltransferase/glycosyltransferase involved in cell wall biosynthesis
MALPDNRQEELLIQSMAGFFDPAWYQQRYPDVAVAGQDPIVHFIRHGLSEQRDPNRFFDSAWYAEHYPDVNASGIHPLLHYLRAGAAELRHPHPRFDAVYYTNQHPEAAANPLLYHIRVGLARGYLTEKPIRIRDYLPSTLKPLPVPDRVTVDVVIPVYRGFAETRTCIESVLANTGAPLGRIIVVDDRSPEPETIAWLQALAVDGRIHLVRNPRNAGFVTSVNNGMSAAGDNDVVLLNSDTEVPPGWLARLSAQAYAEPRIATVSPFSNNATICGYPGNQGGPIAFGASLAEIDAICQDVNAARSVTVPTTVGFCMYIRRAALRAAGVFDAERFTVGYGEETDFCLRTSALGWTHRLACDTFVYHKGSVSFGARAKRLQSRAMSLLLERYPHYARNVAQHVTLGDVTPFRFAVTAALVRQAGQPVILMISHDLGGGVRHHIDRLVTRFRDKAHILLLEATSRGAALSIPALPDHPAMTMPAERVEDLILILRSMNLSRVHIHHLLGMDMDIRDLVHRLGLPFDVTLHDYLAICPQLNLLPRSDSPYCGEPDIAGCNACINARPSHGARDIMTWRAERSWQFHEADRVLCPSIDVVERLRRFGLDDRACLAPHEAAAAGSWPSRIAPERPGPMRIALLGILADHKGARTVASVAEATDAKSFAFHLIGRTEENFPAPALKRLRVSGEYQDADLTTLIEAAGPDIVWFPATWPETFSYTLSAAIAAGVPIVATRIGAFPERLAGRPFTWLVDPDTSPAAWIALFGEIRTVLAKSAETPKPSRRPAVKDFYAEDYLRPLLAPRPPPLPAPLPPPRPVRLRGSPSRPGIAVLPERYETGWPTPCAYIRLLQPLDHPATGGGARIVMADAKSVLDYDVDVIVTQRHALPDLKSADALAAHARLTGAKLVYDLDDDLLNIPPTHPDAAALRPRAAIVRRMLEAADSVWLSTQSLKQSLSTIRPDAIVIENRLDERIWTEPSIPNPFRDEPVRILCMGTSTHDRDFALIEPALGRLKREYRDRIVIDIIGMTNQDSLADGLTRIGPPAQAGRSYPGFVDWLVTAQPRWHIGLVPLLDTAFNRSKSSIKTMDYAAMGLMVLASDVPVYQGSLADGPAGQLVANTPNAWYAALDWFIRDQAARRSAAAGARAAFLSTATLASHADQRHAVWADLLNVSGLRDTPPEPIISHGSTYPVTRQRRHRDRGR